MQVISHDGTTLAMVVRSSFYAEAVDFITPDDNELQVGYMRRPEGYVIPAHRHLVTHRELQNTQEVLYIRSGKMRVDFYSQDAAYLRSIIIGPGDLILLIAGGHGFKVLEAVDLIEVKQGPYVAIEDKGVIEAISDRDVNYGEGSE